MAQTHTPGPWTFHEEPRHEFKDGQVDEGGFRIDGPGVEQLAYIWRNTVRWGPKPDPFGSTLAEGDAKLIAAAPEIVEALQVLIANVLDYEKVNNLAPTPGRKYCWDSVARAVDVLRVAGVEP